MDSGLSAGCRAYGSIEIQVQHNGMKIVLPARPDRMRGWEDPRKPLRRYRGSRPPLVSFRPACIQVEILGTACQVVEVASVSVRTVWVIGWDQAYVGVAAVWLSWTLALPAVSWALELAAVHVDVGVARGAVGVGVGRGAVGVGAARERHNGRRRRRTVSLNLIKAKEKSFADVVDKWAAGSGWRNPTSESRASA